MTRREWMAGVAMISGTMVFGRKARGAREEFEGLQAQVWTIEKTSGGRLGVAVLDTGSGTRFGYRADERFPMCSTFKVLAVGEVLKRVDQGKESLDRVVHYTKSDVLEWAPTTKLHVDTGMTVGALCEAAIALSDNTAANLLLKTVGGPAGVTAFARGLGDGITRLDRNEPTLNEALPGDARDTSSPLAMLDDLQKLVLGGVLTTDSRHRLTTWLIADQTGVRQLRAGFPAGWRVGDKTGSGSNGTANDVAIAWPASGKALLTAVYLTGAKLDRAHQESAIASLGNAVAAHFADR